VVDGVSLSVVLAINMLEQPCHRLLQPRCQRIESSCAAATQIMGR